MAQSKRRLFCFGIPMMIFLAIIINGCSDDDPAQPGVQIYPTFENIWPAAVGQYWVFDLDDRLHDGGSPIFDRREDIPPIPTIEELYTDLKADYRGTPLEVEKGNLRWEIKADATVNPDTTVMIVDQYIENLEGYPSPPQGLKMGPTWKHSGDRIASYGYGFFQWLHLEGALTPGHEFTTQLAEGLSDEIILTSRIWSIRSYNVAGTTYPNCVESFYVLDLGIQQGTDEYGEPSGFFQAYGYGIVIYAPEIGPVYCEAKLLAGPDVIQKRTAVLQDHGGVPTI